MNYRKPLMLLAAILLIGFGSTAIAATGEEPAAIAEKAAEKAAEAVAQEQQKTPAAQEPEEAQAPNV